MHARTARRPARLREPTPEVLAKYFEERKAAVPRAGVPQDHRAGADAGRSRDAGSRCRDDDCKKAYDDRNARATSTPERRQLQQIVFPNDGRGARPPPTSSRQGTTFEALAAERGLKDSDIDLGTVAKAAIVDRAVADAAFALKDGEVSAPVKGRFGTVLVQVGEDRAGQDAAVRGGRGRAQAATSRPSAPGTRSINVHDKIEDERLGGATLAEAAQKLKLKPRIDRGGRPQRPRPGGQRRSPTCRRASMCWRRPSRADVGVENEPLQRAQQRRLRLVRGRRRSRRRATARSTRSRTRSWRAGATTRSPTRLKAKADRDARQDQGRHVVRRRGRGRTAQGRDGGRASSARGPPAGMSAARRSTQIFRTPKDAAGSADGATPTERIVFRVTEITVPPFDAGVGRGQAHRRALRSRASAKTCSRSTSRGSRATSASPSTRPR